MKEPKSNEWRRPWPSLIRWIRNYIEQRTIAKGLSRPMPHREFGNAPLEFKRLTQGDIDR